MKQCSKCKEIKSKKEFYKRKISKDGLRKECKECRKNYQHKYSQINKSKILKYSKEYRKNNLEKIKEYKKINRIKIKKYQKIYNKKYRIKNKNKIAKQIKAYKTNRLMNDTVFRLAHNIRRRMLLALKKNWKAGKTIELLGCSVEDVKYHLKKQFQKGMTWENHGLHGWHIDHIRPCASFDLSDPKQQRACFHYTNLQPLWAKDNLSKGSKII